MKTIKEHYDLYLKYDVLLLANLFEKFKNRCLENYGLCSSHYLSAPALNRDAIFITTEVELDLISGVQIYLFSERGMRGGVPHISKK